MRSKHYLTQVRWSKAIIHLALISPSLLFASPTFGKVKKPDYAFNHAINLNKSVQTEISGTVRDKDGNPLSGVTVSVKNEGRTTSTDSAGKFSISVNSNSSTLTFSYIGYQSKENQPD